MATFEIPNNLGEIRQFNRGDKFGELWSTKNIDLASSPGKIKVSRKLKRVFADGDTVNGTDEFAGTLRALLVYTNLDAAADRKHYYAISTDRSLRCSLDNDPAVATNWSYMVSASNGDFSNSTDAVVFDGLIRISTATNIARFNGGATYADNWWTADIAGTALTSGKPHTLHVHRGGAETICVTDGNLVRFYNSPSGHSTLTLADSLVANTIASGVDSVWIGTYAETSENAYVYEYRIGQTGSTGAILANAAYRIDGQAVMSMDVVDNIPYILTDRGHIQAFNGAGFVTVASFPFAWNNKALSGIEPGIYDYESPPVYPKGMRAKDSSLFINISSSSEDGAFPIDERSHSGIWEFDTVSKNLTHRYSFSDETVDSGIVRTNEAGPILLVGRDDIQIMAGAGSTLDGFYTDSTEDPEGYFITPEFYGDSITQAWEKITHVATLNDGTITTKYRTMKEDGYPILINGVTWLSANQFTTTSSSISEDQIGDEVEIISIFGAGRLCHITDVEGVTTKTVTVDTSFGILNEVSNIRIQNWKKMEEDFTTGGWHSLGTDESAPFVQCKVQLSGDIELQRMIVKGNAKNTV